MPSPACLRAAAPPRRRVAVLLAGLATLAATLAAALLPAAAQARALADIRRSGVIVIASEGRFTPFNFVDDGKLTGFEIEVANAVAAQMGLVVEWRTARFDRLFQGLAADRWDMVIASHGITRARARRVAFAAPHYCTGGVIISHDGVLRSAADLAGKVVAVQAGTTYDDYVRQLPIGAVQAYPLDTQARAALESGRADAWITDRFVARESLAAHHAAGLALGDYLFVERVAAAVSHDNVPLVQAIDRALAAVMADGVYGDISRKWFNEDVRCR